ncbi:hypothetical protein DSM104299_03817 [Baekduia alba]|nr:hypothetical protein DSM104299_03817 [Baekduia alba]
MPQHVSRRRCLSLLGAAALGVVVGSSVGRAVVAPAEGAA